MISISPFVGQLAGSLSQSAGHVAQPIGVWTISKMNRPSVYCVLDSIRTEKRPVDAFGTLSAVTDVSTLITAELDEAYVKLY